MSPPLHHANEAKSNSIRDELSLVEPRSLRTFTPTQAVIARSAGVFHWTPEGKRLYDFTSGVLVANLGHNPRDWFSRFSNYLGWEHNSSNGSASEYLPALPMTAYNAVTPLEVEASRRLIDLCQSRVGGSRLEQVTWAASGSEAIQKALWSSLARDRSRDVILATRFGFHGKKGLAGAVTGSEHDRERDPRVRFISFPMAECQDVSLRDKPFDSTLYQRELDALLYQFGRRIGVLITEPYLGGGGSYHPPLAYLKCLQQFCRENDVLFILDEVQSNFGRTREMFAYEAYGIEPDLVVLGKGLGNGVPVSAVVGRRDVMVSLDYGEASDTWSANPISCAGVLATLDCFQDRAILEQSRRTSSLIEQGLVALKEFPFVANVRGEEGGMVWGVEMREHADRTASEWANALVLAAYQGDPESGDGIHLLGPLARKVIRISPPLIITESEVNRSLSILHQSAASLMSESDVARRPVVTA